MKFILEFTDDGDNRYEYEMYTHAKGYSLILLDIEEKLRYRLKYGDLSEELYKELESLQAFLCEQKSQYHLPLE